VNSESSISDAARVTPCVTRELNSGAHRQGTQAYLEGSPRNGRTYLHYLASSRQRGSRVASKDGARRRSKRDGGLVAHWRARTSPLPARTSPGWGEVSSRPANRDPAPQREIRLGSSTELGSSRIRWGEIRPTNSETVGSQSHSLRQLDSVQPGHMGDRLYLRHG
jgi:hypothetical protein